MIINTLSSDASVSLELGRRIAANENRRWQGRLRLSTMWSRLFLRHPAKVSRGHA